MEGEIITLETAAKLARCDKLEKIIIEANNYINKHQNFIEIDGTIEPLLDEFDPGTSPKKLLSILNIDKDIDVLTKEENI